MGIADIIERIEREWSVVKGAPISFAIAVAAVSGIALYLADYRYAVPLANAGSRIELLETRNASLVDKIASLSEPKPIPGVRDRIAGTSAPAKRPITPDELMAIYAGKTQLQAQPALAPYIGQTLTAKGSVLNVVDQESFAIVGVLSGDTAIFCTFRPITDSVVAMRKGDVIVVIGAVAQVTNLGIELKNCAI